MDKDSFKQILLYNWIIGAVFVAAAIPTLILARIIDQSLGIMSGALFGVLYVMSAIVLFGIVYSYR